jgi:hypothetical protein
MLVRSISPSVAYGSHFEALMLAKNTALVAAKAIGASFIGSR